MILKNLFRREPAFTKQDFKQMIKYMTSSRGSWRQFWGSGQDGDFYGSIKSAKTPYKQSIWVYRCMQIWQRVSTIPIVVENEITGKEVDSGPIPFLLNSPNSRMDKTAFMKWTLLALGNCGEFFWLREDGNNYNGIPSYLDPVWPGRMSIDDKDVDSMGKVLRWTLNMGQGRQRKIDTRGVIHDMFPNPWNPNRGLSPLDAADLTVQADYDARVHNRWMQKRHGNMAGVISFEDVDDAELPQLQKRFNEKHEGSDNAGKWAFFGSKAQVTPTSHTMKDMDWNLSQKLSREEIAAAFGIPPNNAGILDKATYSNFEQSSLSLWEDTLIPLGDGVTSVINRALIKPNDSKLVCYFDFLNNVSALQADEKDKADRYAVFVKNKISPAKAAQLTGIDLGDITPEQEKIWITLGETTVDQMQSQDAGAKDDNTKNLTEAIAMLAAKVDLVSEDLRKIKTDHVAQTTAQERPEANKSTALSEELRQAHGRSIINQGSAYEKKLDRVLKRYFYEQRSDILARAAKLDLKAAKGIEIKATAETASEITSRLLAGRNWDEDLIKAVQPILMAVGERAAQRVLAEIGKPELQSAENLLASYFEGQAVMMKKVNETTAQALRAVVDDMVTGLTEGLPIADITDAMKTGMKDVFNNTEARRRTIARTETLRTINAARFEEMNSVGVPLKEWLTVRDDSVRESHLMLDGVTIGIDESWDTPDGEILYPGDPMATAGNTINCRCTILAIFKEKE